METVGHLGVPIFNRWNTGCQWCHMPRKAESFPVCRNPEAILDHYFDHAFLLGCERDATECQYYQQQQERPSHRVLIERYLDKYSDDGFVLIPPSHVSRLLEKMDMDGVLYLYVLLKSFGWFQIEKDEGLDEGILFTNKQTKALQAVAKVEMVEAV